MLVWGTLSLLWWPWSSGCILSRKRQHSSVVRGILAGGTFTSPFHESRTLLPVTVFMNDTSFKGSALISCVPIWRLHPSKDWRLQGCSLCVLRRTLHVAFVGFLNCAASQVFPITAPGAKQRCESMLPSWSFIWYNWVNSYGARIGYCHFYVLYFTGGHGIKDVSGHVLSA